MPRLDGLASQGSQCTERGASRSARRGARSLGAVRRQDRGAGPALARAVRPVVGLRGCEAGHRHVDHRGRALVGLGLGLRVCGGRRIPVSSDGMVGSRASTEASTASTEGRASASISRSSTGPVRSSILARRSRTARPARSRIAGLAMMTALAAPTTTTAPATYGQRDRRASGRPSRAIAAAPARAPPRSIERQSNRRIESGSTILGRSMAARSSVGTRTSESERTISSRLISGRWSSDRRTSWTGSSGT